MRLGLPITQTQRFVYVLVTSAFITLLFFASLHIYEVEAFLVLMIVEFFALVELTKLPSIHVSWRRNTNVFIAVCIIIFAAIVFRRALLVLGQT